MDREAIQEVKYGFPYHHLCHQTERQWNAARALPWAYEYLGLIEVVVAEVLSQQPRRVLDFGCGDGRLLVELAERGISELAGVDVSDRARSFASGFLAERSVPLYRNLAELSKKRFDVVVAMEVLEHIPEEHLTATLTAIRAVLHDEGLFVVSVPTINRKVIPKHYRHYTTRLLEEQTAGLFTLVETRFVQRIGMFAELIRRMVVNRFFIATYPPWLRLATIMYRKLVMYADAGDGAHLIAILRRRQ